MQTVSWTTTTEGDRVARFDGARWLLEIRGVHAAGAAVARRSPEGESALLVLGGTHDLFAGGGSWVRRGLRASPFDGGRPVAVFLPPNTAWRAENGHGDLLVVTVRQPAPPRVDEPRDELARKPLLQMAGSGKAFDPVSGTWKPSEAFLSSPEAILPRRIELVGSPSGATIARVLPADYKALGLCVDEVVLAPGQCASPPSPDGGSPDYPAEIAVHVTTEGEATVGDLTVRAADGPCVVRAPDLHAPRVAAVDGRCHAVFVYAGAKAST